MATKRTTPYAFFLAHAGYSVDVAPQCARGLAAAEKWAADQGLVYSWVEDTDFDPNCFDDPRDVEFARENGAVGCILSRLCPLCAGHAVVTDCCRHTEVLASLWGIVESLNNRDRDNYRRVVEAELASEVML